MADTNKGVVYTGPGSVEVQDLDYPARPRGRPSAARWQIGQ